MGQQQEPRLKIYTDGACSTNGTWESGAAMIASFEDKILLRKGIYLGKATNNIAELKGIEIALDFLSAPIHYPNNIDILSDSAYIVNCFNDGWYKKWQKNGWYTSQKKKVANQEIWESIIEKYNQLSRHYNITFVKVKGHSDDKFNNEVDKIAVFCKDNKTDF